MTTVPSSSSTADRTWVALSGGVDSAVAAVMLLEEGRELAGVTMRLAEPGASLSHDRSIEAAAAVSSVLGIEHHIVDMTSAFSRIIDDTLRRRTSGLTPNPCVHCNQTLKFGEFLDAAIAGGASALATGHYVRVVDDDDGSLAIARGLDATKDQSYFLYRISHSALRSCLFPLGALTKDAVVRRASDLELPVLPSESQDICIPELFDVSKPSRAGKIVDRSGAELARHDGVAGFTVGQRKGIGIGGGEPLYVLAIDSSSGDVTVGPRSALDRTRVRAVDPVWYGPDEASCLAMVRYRSVPQPAVARFRDDVLHVEFSNPVDAPAPGQSVVCYEGDRVIGGGIISSAS